MSENIFGPQGICLKIFFGTTIFSPPKPPLIVIGLILAGGRGGLSSDIYPQVYSPICRSLVHSLLVDFGVVLLVVIVVVLLVLVTGVKQSQLLVPRLKSGLWTGV